MTFGSAAQSLDASLVATGHVTSEESPNLFEPQTFSCHVSVLQCLSADMRNVGRWPNKGAGARWWLSSRTGCSERSSTWEGSQSEFRNGLDPTRHMLACGSGQDCGGMMLSLSLDHGGNK